MILICNSLRIPLMVRGPGIIGGTERDAVALSIDLAPTILDMAGIEIPNNMDGMSLLPLLTVRNEFFTGSVLNIGPHFRIPTSQESQLVDSS